MKMIKLILDMIILQIVSKQIDSWIKKKINSLIKEQSITVVVESITIFLLSKTTTN